MVGLHCSYVFRSYTKYYWIVLLTRPQILYMLEQIYALDIKFKPVRSFRLFAKNKILFRDVILDQMQQVPMAYELLFIQVEHYWSYVCWSHIKNYMIYMMFYCIFVCSMIATYYITYLCNQINLWPDSINFWKLNFCERYQTSLW